MGTPFPSSKNVAAPARPDADDTHNPAPDGDRLEGLDLILAEVAQKDVEAIAAAARLAEDERAFRELFTNVCQNEVRPAMQAVVDRLVSDGGGGLIEEHPGAEPRFHNPSLVLWMSLEGAIDASPRPDRNPYLRLDAKVASRDVQVVEGDMWRGGRGTHSGPSDTWQLSEITRDLVTDRVLEIARRSAG